jgi:hypothetical protein
LLSRLGALLLLGLRQGLDLLLQLVDLRPQTELAVDSVEEVLFLLLRVALVALLAGLSRSLPLGVRASSLAVSFLDVCSFDGRTSELRPLTPWAGACSPGAWVFSLFNASACNRGGAWESRKRLAFCL